MSSLLLRRAAPLSASLRSAQRRVISAMPDFTQPCARTPDFAPAKAQVDPEPGNHEPNLFWTDIWADYTPLIASEDAQEVSKSSSPSNSAAALAEPIMEHGVHDLTFEVTGDCVVGVATAFRAAGTHWLAGPSEQLWRGKAWGLDAPSGCLLHASSAVHEGVLSTALASPSETGNAAARRVEVRVDMATRRLEIDGVDAGIRLPSAVRPWALFPKGHADEVLPSARLVSHTSLAVPLQRVAGLAAVVGELPVQQQALALAWCDAEGAPSVRAIVAAGEAAAFVASFNPWPEDDERVWAAIDELAR